MKEGKMSVVKQLDDLENNENNANNGCDIRWRDYSGSQEMFSDDEQLKNSILLSPNAAVKNETLNSSIISLKTPLLCSKVTEMTPGKAVVPRTPADLQQYITKTSVLWTSDMETPQSKLEKSDNSNKTISLIDINNTTPNRLLNSPTCKMKTNKVDVTSPVLGGKKRSKRKVKRRILNNLGLDLDNNNDQQTSISSSSDKVPSEATSVASNDVASVNELEINSSPITKECNALTNGESIITITKECNSSAIKETPSTSTECTIVTVKEEFISDKTEFKDNKKLEEAVIFDKNSNTSTQEFFCNASFSSIDRLCCSAIQEEKPNLTPALDEPKDSKIEVIKKEINDEEKGKTLNISNDVLEKVASIRRNQKPLRRWSDINYTNIPKEQFSKSLRDLELADTKFNHLKQTNKQLKPLQLKSFQSLSTIEKELSVIKEKSPTKENMPNSSSQLVPADILDDWPTDIELDLKEEKCKQIDKLIVLNADVNFSKANGEKITINEKNLKQRMKIYCEIQNEICNSNDFLTLEKSIIKQPLNQSKNINSNINLKSANNTISNKLLNLANGHEETEGGFSTASGKNIAISEDKIFDYEKVYEELGNENLNENSFLELKKNSNKSSLRLNFGRKDELEQKSTLKSNTEKKEFSANIHKSETNKKAETLKLFQDLDLQEFLEPKFSPQKSEDVDDGFATAAGRGIKVNLEKENYFSKIYNELDIKENSFLDAKKNKKKFNEKPNDKALLIFDKNEVNKANELTQVLVKTEPGISQIEVMSNNFSTASGKGIKVSDEKQNYYSKIYDELNDCDESSLLDLKKNKISNLNTENKPNDKALIIFNKNESNSNNEIPIVAVKTESKVPNAELECKVVASDGFSTAGGKDIKINFEKEKYYSKIYNELDDSTNEEDFIDLKKTALSKINLNMNTNNKSSITLNKKENKINVQENNKMIATSETSSNGFSTAGGKGIKISEEKENFYLKLYNQLSTDISDENCFLNKNKNELSKGETIKKPKGGAPIVSDQIKTENAIAKLSMSSDTDEAFYDLGDVEKLLVPPNQASQLNKEIESENGFTIPNSTNILKKVNQTTTVTLNEQNNSLMTNYKRKLENKENLIEGLKANKVTKNDSNLLKSLQETKSLETENTLKSMPYKSQVEMLKQKLENCEAKRTGRCRSFGGFPISSDNVSTPKLNKSDPIDEPVVNQPLQKCLSVSQCFDSHSDSWLSKVEISFLNSSKTKSPNLKVEKNNKQEKNELIMPKDKKLEEFKEFLGFTYKECTKSFRYYSCFKKFLKNQRAKYDRQTKLQIENGHTISLCNKTSSKQQIFVQSRNNVEIKNTSNESSYILVDVKPDTTPFRLPEDRELKAQEEKAKEKKHVEVIGKRKHADTDSDTPLSTLKKPRIGSELQGRKLFSDESETEENDYNFKKPVEPANMSPPSEVVGVLTAQEEQDLLEERANAILQQEKTIRNKKRIKVKPEIGSLLRHRLANSKNRVSWSELIGDSSPKARSIGQIKENHPDANILEVTAANATCYTFLTSNVVNHKKTVSLDVGDGALLIFDENGHAGVLEFTEAFLAMPGVDPKLVPSGWVENHYKWIIWKLASIDRIQFNSIQLPKILTPERVMKELKYRYDREIDKAQRSALRKILEKDDVPSRRMVLCISSIIENTNIEEAEKEKEVKAMLGLLRWKIEATDGWYDIPLTIDSAMANYISTGKIKEGTKIVTYGAELLECEKGFFPLEKPTNVSLKIHTNCTRRARWDAKLGYQKISKPIPVKLRNIVPSGGMVGETTAVAARIYPLLYREKTPSGQSIYRNARSEEKAAIAHERAVELKVDAMYAEAQKKFDSKKKSDSDEDVENSQVPNTMQAKTHKFNHWEKKQEEFKQKLESQVRQGLPPPRQVTAVLKVRLVDDKSTVILTIWGANEDSSYDIKEGNTITIYNCYAAGTRGGELNLTANRITHIKKEPLLKLPYPCRTMTLISDMMSPSFEPKFCEFDTVGIVVSMGAAPYGMKNFEMVNLAYPKQNSSASSYMAILFWNGVSSFGYQGMFTVGSFIACSNLEWRRNTSWSIAVAYCSEKSVFTTNPRQQHLMKELRDLKALIRNPTVYVESCSEEVATELQKKLQPRSNQNTPTSWSDRSSLNNNSSLISPMNTLSPGNVMIQRRLEMLSRYSNSGSSDISPIVLNNSSSKVKKDFTPVTCKKS